MVVVVVILLLRAWTVPQQPAKVAIAKFRFNYHENVTRTTTKNKIIESSPERRTTTIMCGCGCVLQHTTSASCLAPWSEKYCIESDCCFYTNYQHSLLVLHINLFHFILLLQQSSSTAPCTVHKHTHTHRQIIPSFHFYCHLKLDKYTYDVVAVVWRGSENALQLHRLSILFRSIAFRLSALAFFRNLIRKLECSSTYTSWII